MDLDFSGYLYVLLALLFVLALIVLIATLARRFGLGFSGGTKTGGGRRLSIIEVLTLSPKHRLVLIQRDDTEHLLLLGDKSDLVVEGRINKPRFADALEETTQEHSS